METESHCIQSRVYLVSPLQAYFERRGVTAFVGGNSFVYYEPPAKNVGPDVYVVNGGRPDLQDGWVAWLEGGLLPTLIIELLSPSTEKEDRGRKFTLYRDIFKTPDYFLYDIGLRRLEGFRLVAGDYLPVLPGPYGRMPCQSLDLSLGVHDGWLRWFEADGTLVPTSREIADRACRLHEEAQHAYEQERRLREQERQLLEQERRSLEHERRRAESADAELQRLREELRRLRGE